MKEKILVINDDESTRDVIKLILESNGYELSEATNGKEGIAEALKIKPDLILLDIMMPEMNGFEACEKLKADPLTTDIPILFFSSLTNPKDKIKGLELGAVDFINNVIDQGELIARVQTHLKIQALTHALKQSNDELIQKQKALDEDLSAAAAIQQSFLPPPGLQTSGLRTASFWYPANPLGGDIFNIIQRKDDETIFYMVDVSGHDVPSALVTISVSQFLQQRANTDSSLSPKEIMMALDEEYPFERFNRYFTIFYLSLNPLTGQFKYSCAGHPPAIKIKRNGPLQLLDVGGTIIGMNNTFPFEEAEGALEEGDRVLLYTDGILELTNSRGEQYGFERFYGLLEKMKEDPIDRIVQMIYESLKNFNTNFQDDTSLIGFERNSIQRENE